MANKAFNISLGRTQQLVRNVASGSPANSGIVVVLLKVQQTPEDSLLDQPTLAAILAGGSTEANFTNYARKVVSGANASFTVDNANNWATVAVPNQLYTSAGGATNNTLVAAVLCYDPDTTGGTDADLIPLSKLDLSYTTVGTDMMLVFNNSYFHRSERG